MGFFDRFKARTRIRTDEQDEQASSNSTIAGRAKPYGDDFTKGLSSAHWHQVDAAVSTVSETSGMTQGDLNRLLEPIVGKDRADVIGVTEVTRAASQRTNEHQRELAAAGIAMRRVWGSRADETVCGVCGPLHGVPEDDWRDQFPNGPPARPGCRCSTSLTIQTADEVRKKWRRLQAERRSVFGQ